MADGSISPSPMKLKISDQAMESGAESPWFESQFYYLLRAITVEQIT